MGDYWFTVGLLMAVFGPLSLLLPGWLLYWLLRRLRIAQRLGAARPVAVRGLHIALAAGVLLIVVGATWLPGRLEFARLCGELAEPRIYTRVQADGFYLDDSTANSFGQRYLYDEGFAWMEARDIYKRDGHVRYRREGKGIATDPIPALSAAYLVRSGVDVRSGGINVARTEIIERASGRLLAEAHSVNYRGGPLGLLLGVYGSAHCPDPITTDGNRQFKGYYHLVRDVLGGAPAKP